MILQPIARDLADEIAGLCTGSGPWARFLNGTTNIDLTRAGREWISPRVFSFHELESDPILLMLCNLKPGEALTIESSLEGFDVTQAAGTILVSDAITAHNIDEPDRVKPAPFDGASLNGNTLKIRLPAASVVALSLT